MERRVFLGAIACLVSPRWAFGSELSKENFDKVLSVVSSNEQLIEQAKQYREYSLRELGPSDSEILAQPHLPKRYNSAKSISRKSFDLIVLFEVSGQKTYEKKYRKPIWPGGASGVTLGVGYDLGYVREADFAIDWKDFLPKATIDGLSAVCGNKGADAQDNLSFVSDFDIPWSAAIQQFQSFLPAVKGETIHAFPEAQNLSDDSFGALVSLVYNRGSSMKKADKDPLDRRIEMRNIRDLLAAGNLAGIPQEILNMRRLWDKDPKAKGLVLRRELEADLFASGI